MLDGGRKKKIGESQERRERGATEDTLSRGSSKRSRSFWLLIVSQGLLAPFPAFLSPNFPFCPHYLSLGLQGDNLVNCEEVKNLETRLALFKEREENGLQLKPARCKCKQIMSHSINSRKVRKLSRTPYTSTHSLVCTHTHTHSRVNRVILYLKRMFAAFFNRHVPKKKDFFWILLICCN